MQAIEALRRAKFKFAGRQKIIESNNWGFTKFHMQDYIDWKKQGRIVNRGVHAEVRPQATVPAPHCSAPSTGRRRSLLLLQRSDHVTAAAALMACIPPVLCIV